MGHSIHEYQREISVRSSGVEEGYWECDESVPKYRPEAELSEIRLLSRDRTWIMILRYPHIAFWCMHVSSLVPWVPQRNFGALYGGFHFIIEFSYSYFWQIRGWSEKFPTYPITDVKFWTSSRWVGTRTGAGVRHSSVKHFWSQLKAPWTSATPWECAAAQSMEPWVAKESFTLLWRWYQFLSGSLPNGRPSRVSRRL